VRACPARLLSAARASASTPSQNRYAGVALGFVCGANCSILRSAGGRLAGAASALHN